MPRQRNPIPDCNKPEKINIISSSLTGPLCYFIGAVLDKKATAKVGAPQYYCKTCQPSQVLRHTFGTSNLSKHPGTATHQRSVADFTAQEEVAAARRANASFEANQQFTLDPIPEVDFDAPEIFEPEIQTASHYNYYHAADGTEVVFDVGQHITASHKAAEMTRLRRELEVLEQGVEDDWEEDDITISEALQELRACGRFLFEYIKHGDLHCRPCPSRNGGY